MLRKRISIPAIVLYSLFTFACGVEAPEEKPDSMFRGNPAHTGLYETESLREFHAEKWRFETGGAVIGSPALADGVLYVGSDDSLLYALEASSGEVLWSFQTMGQIRSTPAISKGLVLFGGGDGSFYALDARTGESVWEFVTAGEARFSAYGILGLAPKDSIRYDPWDCFQSSPSVSEGKIYFGMGDGSVYALELSTGRHLWTYQTGGVVHSSPAVAYGKVFIGSWDNYLYALDANTGAQIWRFETGDDPENHIMCGIQGSPAVGDSVVYFGARDGNLYAVSQKDGSLVWSYSTKPSWVVSSPALSGDLVLFGTSDTNRFIGLDRLTGEPRFDFNAGMYVFSSPAATSETVYFGGFNGRLYALGLPEGKALWEFKTEGGLADPYSVVSPNGTMNLKAFAADTALTHDTMLSIMHKLLAAGPVLSSPVVDKGVIYFGSADGYVYAIH